MSSLKHSDITEFESHTIQPRWGW